MDYPFDFMLRRLASGNNIFHTSKVRFPLIKLASNVVAFFAGIKLLLCRNNLRKVKVILQNKYSDSTGKSKC